MRLFKQRRGGKPYKKWTLEIVDHLASRRKIQAFPDKGASESLGHTLEKLVAYKSAKRSPDADLTAWLESLPPRMMKRLFAIGLIDGATTAATKPLMVARKCKKKNSSHETFDVTGGHLHDYKQHMEARELTKKRINDVISGCAKIIDARHWTFPSDITAAGLEAYLCELRSNGVSAQRLNDMRGYMKAFCNWAKREGRIATNPAARVGKLNAKVDRRIIRRPLTINEIPRLIAATVSGKPHHGLTGTERALIYRLALETGLRHGEIRKLRRVDFHLTADPASVTIRAQDEKAGRGDTLPLRPDLARDLDTYFKTRLALPGASAFPNMGTKGAEMLRQDLDAAGIDWREDASGAILDFHALRHTFGTMLAASGVHPKTAMDLMRHSDVNLTLGLYSHTLIEDRAKAVANLPDFTAPEKEVKTGTADIDESATENHFGKAALKQGEKQGDDLPKSAFCGKVPAENKIIVSEKQKNAETL